MYPDAVWHDLRHGLRSWRSQRSLYAVAIVALALGIGANTTIYSIIQTVLIRPLPYREPDRLVSIFETSFKTGVQRYYASPSDYYDWRDRPRPPGAFWRDLGNRLHHTGGHGRPGRIL